MGFKAVEPPRGGTLLFTTKLASILSSPKHLQLFFNSHVLIANSEKYTLAECALFVNDYWNADCGIQLHKF